MEVLDTDSTHHLSDQESFSQVSSLFGGTFGNDGDEKQTVVNIENNLQELFSQINEDLSEEDWKGLIQKLEDSAYIPYVVGSLTTFLERLPAPAVYL